MPWVRDSNTVYMRVLPIEVADLDGQIANGIDISEFNEIHGRRQTINNLVNKMSEPQQIYRNDQSGNIISIYGMRVIVSDQVPENQVILMDTRRLFQEMIMEIREQAREVRLEDIERIWRISGEWDLSQPVDDKQKDSPKTEAWLERWARRR